MTSTTSGSPETMPKNCLEILKQAKAKLKARNIESGQLEAELILAFVLGCQKHELHLEPKRILTQKESDCFQILLEQRLCGKPLQYILGQTYFFRYKFKVNPKVLIPRPETEILVNEVIALLEEKKNPRIIDLGTGSGNIAVSLALNLSDAQFLATDISPSALKVAKDNARMNKVDSRIEFLCGDLFEPIKTKVDTIVSNPPYVSEEEFTKLPDQIRDFEPKQALLAGKDGLDFIRKIIDQAPEFLVSEGLLALEIGFGQDGKVKETICKNKGCELIDIRKDLSGIPRVVLARKL